MSRRKLVCRLRYASRGAWRERQITVYVARATFPCLLDAVERVFARHPARGSIRFGVEPLGFGRHRVKARRLFAGASNAEVETPALPIFEQPTLPQSADRVGFLKAMPAGNVFKFQYGVVSRRGGAR